MYFSQTSMISPPRFGEGPGEGCQEGIAKDKIANCQGKINDVTFN